MEMLGVLQLPIFEALKGCSVAVTALGAITMTLAFWPQFSSIYKSKDSSQLPVKVFMLHLTTSCLILIGSIVGLFGGTDWKSYTNGGIYVYLNLFLLSTCGYMMWLKFSNMKKAKELCIPEIEVCEMRRKAALGK
ncbi:hypothetical protein MHLP_04475 [Candidatus Mycoplasma haematolamae str. Purdue]|uniref:Uncharacterized protein n=1 Tax=Mycoplasma haematolamae (strain Purdue) TaxID=1212765 RepID=I7BB06_MYCHA|nr:hypothetical protein [Candidatus Mycoplasma haematolamae]AFO52475.1 hypothetical protein MHLP_04475 [Candidatus Mycoplasma haematolamae str. Purdue]